VTFQVVAMITVVAIVIPALLMLDPRFLIASTLDRLVALLLIAELALAAALCRASTGAWLNYGIPTILMASVLLGRALDRALVQPRLVSPYPPPRLGWLALAAIAPLVSSVSLIQYVVSQRELERIERNFVLAKMACPPSEVFFVDRPGANRRNGRLDLVYDHWLYPVFETIHLAEPRSSWLAAKLANGSINLVVNTSDHDGIDRVTPSLSRLGFVKRIKVGQYFVWERPVYARPRRR
jgi:hypothetical protein